MCLSRGRRAPDTCRPRRIGAGTRLASTQGWPDSCTSQFDLQFIRKRELISNLRQNMPVSPDSSEYMALGADMSEGRLERRFQHACIGKA